MNINNTFLYILLSICFIPKFYTQNKKDTLVASKSFKKADSLLLNKSYKKSILHFNKALNEFKNHNSYKRIADCYQKLGENYEETSNYSKALEFYEKSYNLSKEKLPVNHANISKSLSDMAGINYKTSKYKNALLLFEKALKITLINYGEKHQETGNIYNNIGVCYYSLGDLHTALNYLKKSLNIDIDKLEKNHINIGFSYNNIGLIHFELKQDEQAMENYQKALPYFIKNNYNKGVLGVYNNIGNILKSKGKLNEALKYYQKSLSINLKYYKEDIYTLSLIYQNIGDLYRKLEIYDKALIYLNKSLEKSNSILNKNHDNVARVYENIGSLYSSKEEYNIALNYYKKALKIKENTGNTIEIANSLKLIGELKYKNKMYHDALSYLQKGLETIQKTYGTNHLLTSNFNYNLGIVYQKNNDFNNALKHLNKAIISNSKKNQTLNNKPINPNNYFDHQLLLKTLHEKANTLQLKYTHSKENSYLNKSIKLYYKADVVIDYIRQSFNDYQDKLVSAKQAKTIYTDAIAAYILLYKDSGSEKHIEGAWYFAEKSRSNTLKDLLNDTNAKKNSNLPENLLDLEKKLKSDRSYYQSKIVEAQSKNTLNIATVKNFENELFTINQKNDSLIKKLKKEHPKYYQLKHKNNHFSIKEIQKKLNKKTTILEFFTVENKVYSFTASKNNISIKELEVSKLSKKIEHFRKTIVTENINEYKKTANTLYKELIKPIKNKFTGDELIIIPDGALWYLNFDILLTQKNDTQNARKLSYLLNDYAICYANSLDLIFNPINKNSKQPSVRKECLGFSFSNATNNTELNLKKQKKEDLPGARKEIKLISEIIDGKYYYGSDALEATFKKNADKYQILHLALHGEVDNEKPQNSRLYFTKNKDSIEDNILYNHELFALNIPAELVVLSACDTGTGKIANGEGLMSLGNAFQYAGTKSLLLSKWEVPDKTTPELMKYFYLNLKNGMSKSKSLQQAKLKYLKTTETFYTNPFYWSSFYILGNTDSINFDNNYNTTYYWLIGIFSFLFLIWLFIRNKSNKSKKL